MREGPDAPRSGDWKSGREGLESVGAELRIQTEVAHTNNGRYSFTILMRQPL